MSGAAIELEGVGKRYWKISERSLLRSLIPFGPPNRTQLWALRDIDLRIDPGETVGLIGRNGAGKTSLLRLLAGVTQPTAGTVVTRGRTAPLLSVGVGFHPEMTGRENVYVNGMLLGLSRSEVAARFDDIVAFADLAEFIDTPVKFYSSGMFMRLGFSVAVNSDPDTLLVDEVLAVGDVQFQLRCLDRIRSLSRLGTTIVFVSHSMHAIHLICSRTVLVHAGRIELDGPTEAAIGRYHELMAAGDDERDRGSVRVLHRELLVDGARVESVDQGSLLMYRVRIRFERPVDGPGVHFRVLAEDGVLAYSMGTTIGERWRRYAPGEEASVCVTFHSRLGGGGTFRIALDVTDCHSNVLVSDPFGPSFFVAPRVGVAGPADLDATITVDDEIRTNHSWTRLDGTQPTNLASGAG
jgi:ABC-2 type transport system ATP-binding protein